VHQSWRQKNGLFSYGVICRSREGSDPSRAEPERGHTARPRRRGHASRAGLRPGRQGQRRAVRGGRLNGVRVLNQREVAPPAEELVVLGLAQPRRIRPKARPRWAPRDGQLDKVRRERRARVAARNHLGRPGAVGGRARRAACVAVRRGTGHEGGAPCRRR
jgi:hypothetical protein